jgi:hypothetical protein
LPQLGDDLFRLMTLLQHCGPPPPSEDILQGGPIQWGRISFESAKATARQMR